MKGLLLGILTVFLCQQANSLKLNDYKSSAVATYGIDEQWGGTVFYINQTEAITAKHG